MNPMIVILEELGLSELENVVVPAVKVVLIATPSATDAQLQTIVDGNIKHTARQKVGWLVDFAWPFVEPYVQSVIASAIPQARAALTPAFSAPPPAPAAKAEPTYS